jgi:hypothetical protein
LLVRAADWSKRQGLKGSRAQGVKRQTDLTNAQFSMFNSHPSGADGFAKHGLGVFSISNHWELKIEHWSDLFAA